MLNPFPSLLDFGFFAPTLLRVAVALVFFTLAYHHVKNRDAVARTHFLILGARSWVAWVGALIDVLVGIGLFFGAWTQVAALVGALLGLKYAFWRGKYPAYFILPRSTALLIAIVCLSLMFTGAGAFAFDLPL